MTTKLYRSINVHHRSYKTKSKAYEFLFLLAPWLHKSAMLHGRCMHIHVIQLQQVFTVSTPIVVGAIKSNSLG